MKRLLLSLTLVLLIPTSIFAQWETVTLGTSENLYDVFFLNQSTGWIAGNASIYKTEDGGSNWNSQISGIVTTTRYYDIYFKDSQNGWAVGRATSGTAGRVQYTTDGGITWQVYSTSGTLPWWSIDFANDNQGAIVGQEGQILYTADGGTNWSSRNSPSGDAGIIREVEFYDGLNGIAVGYSTPSVGFIMKTTDGGNSWTNIDTNIAGGLNAVSFKDNLVGVAVGSSGSIYRTEDGGNSWTQMTSSTTQSLRAVHFNGANVLSVGFSGTILKSIDSGLNWTTEQTNSSGALRGIFQNSSNSDFAVGSLGETLSYCNECNNMTVFNIDYQETEVAELDMLDLSISADNSTSTKFRYFGTDFPDVILRIKEDENSDNTSLWGNFTDRLEENDYTEFKYSHPEYFDISGEKEKEATIEVYNPLTDEIITEFSFKIVRPSVLMAHGLWGSDKTFADLKFNLLQENMYEDRQLKIVVYPNDKPNSSNAYYFIRDKDTLKNKEIQNNVSSGKFDVIAHSNGGLLTRLYIQSIENYKEDINKLITYNTPHSGSQMADLLLDSDFSFLTPILASMGFKVDGGLVNDLRVEGNFINNLRIIETNNPSYVSVHSLTSTYNVGILESIGIQNKWNDIVVEAGKLHLQMNGVDNFLNDLFNDDDTDLVVPLTSQKGGLNNNQTSNTTEQWHIESTENDDMRNDVINLLNSNPNNINLFNADGFQPPVLNYDFNNGTSGRSSSQQSNETLSIISPAEATEYNAGDTVTIDISGSFGIQNILSSMGNIRIPLQNHIIENSSSDNFNFIIPDNALGRLEIVSVGFDANGYADYDSTYIIVNTNALLQSIEIVQNLIYVPEGRQEFITILGNYDDGITRDITNVNGLSYTFDNQNAEILEAGLVNGLTEGEDLLTVTYQGESDTVPITIANASEWVEVTLSNEDVSTLDNSLILFPNPTNEIININFSNSVSAAKIIIYDTTGKIILTNEIENSDSNQINISNLNNGIYFVKIETNEKSETKKIIKN